MANIGQLKQFATKAALELNVHLPGGAGLDINNLVAIWTTPPSGGVVRDDFAAVNLGQVKSAAKLFYDKLIGWHYTDTYPWADGLADDFALANLGQIKSLFAFDLTYDSDGDGIPDWWEFAAHLNPNDPGDAAGIATDGSGQTNAQRWLAGVNPATVNPVPPGTPAPGSGKPMLDLGTVTFAAIDVSSALTTADASDVAIDDQNHVAFAYPPAGPSEFLRTAVFADGAAGSVKIFPADAPKTIDDIVYSIGRRCTSLTASGAIAGVADYLGETGNWFARAFVSNGGSPTEIWPAVPADALGIQPMGNLNPYSQDSYVTCGYAGWLSGSFESPYWGPLGLTGQAGQPRWEWLPDWHQPDEWVYFAFRNRDFSPARLASPAGTTAGYYALTPYWGLNFDPPNYGVCVGGGPVSIGQLYPLAVSDSGIVLGDNEALPAAQLSAGLDTVSVFDNDGATSLLSSHLPKVYQGKIRFPRSQSSALWVNDHGDVIVEAEVYDETASPTFENRWLRRRILWRNALSMGTDPSTLCFVRFPSGASLKQFNNKGNFCAVMSNVPISDSITGVVIAHHNTAGLLLPFDLSIDSNNTDDINHKPTGSLAEEENEDAADGNGIVPDERPGKVMQVNDWDVDQDGIVDYADGFNLHDYGLPQDDICIGAKFAKLVATVTASDWQNAKVKFTYDASDPSALTATGTDPYVLPSGKIRIWKRDGGESRDKRPIKDGGDWLMPGVEYTPQELGFSQTQSTVTFYVEVVKASEKTGDILIKIETDPSGNMGYVLRDQVRMTGIRFELLGRQIEEAEYGVVDRIGSSTLEGFDEYYATHQMTPGAYRTYLVHLHDPRKTGLKDIKINGLSIPLTREDHYWQSEQFIATKSGEAIGLSDPPHYIVHNTDEAFAWKYNPGGKGNSNGQVNPVTAADQAVADEIKKAVGAMKSSNWTGTHDGSFGIEVHRRVGITLGEKSGWLVDVYVDQATNEIRSIGQIPPGGTSGTTQVDLIRLKNGYNPQVGQVLDPSKIEGLYEIKTSIGGKVNVDQKARLKNVVGGRNIKVALSKERWLVGGGWQINKRVAAVFKILSVIGAGFTAYNYLHQDDFDDELDAIREQGFAVNQETDPGEKKVEGLILMGMMRTYLDHFINDSTGVDAVLVGIIYNQILRDEGFRP